MVTCKEIGLRLQLYSLHLFILCMIRTWDNSLLEDACHTLAEDLLVLPGAPGGREAYRQSLSLSFFFKFYLFVLKALKETQVCYLTHSLIKAKCVL